MRVKKGTSSNLILGAATVGGLLISIVIFLFGVASRMEQRKCESGYKYDSLLDKCIIDWGSKDSNNNPVSTLEEQRKKAEEEIEKVRKKGQVCLTTDEAWNNVGKKACVILNYRRMAAYNGYFYLDEYEDYDNGFVAFFAKRWMTTWAKFKKKYYNKGPVAVYGKIVWYKGHPEIKVTSFKQVTKPVLINCITSEGCVYKRGKEAL